VKYLLILALAFAQGNGPGQTPAQPWPGHGQPTEGWFCVPAMTEKQTQTDAHACTCRGMVMQDPDPFCWTPSEDEDGNQVMVPVGENAKCKVYCHKDHCKCRVRCIDS
jgi:hypothetical protein